MRNFKEIFELIIRAFVLVIAAFMLLVGIQGCQKEADIIIAPNDVEVMTTASPVHSTMIRTATHDGSGDNIIDQSSCTSVVLPITVIVKGLEIVIDSEQDFYTIEKIFDEFDGDDDVLEFIFPITVVLSDFSEVKINSDDELEAIINLCSTEEDDDIECVDFKYPILFSIYNSEKQIADTKEINDDQELYHFLHEMEENDYVGINFPITLLLFDGTEVIANDNIELNNLIENSKDACDEDDDNDYNDDDADDTLLLVSLLDGKWEITMFTNVSDSLEHFSGFIFEFFEDGNVIANKENVEIQGKWVTNGDDGHLKLELYFGDEVPFSELNEDWKIFEFDSSFIKLYDEDDTNTNPVYLKFERPTPIEPILSVSQVLPGNAWIVALYQEGEEVKTSYYNDYLLEFWEDGSVFAKKGDVTIQGTWNELMENEIDKLALFFGEVPFDEFYEDWQIISVQENRVELKYTSMDDGTVSVLVFER